MTEGSLELSNRTSCAVMMALTCSKFMSIALSLPTIVDEYDSSGSSIRRSRAATPVRRIITCLLASTASLSPPAPTTAHVLAPLPFLRMGRVVTGSLILQLQASVTLDCSFGRGNHGCDHVTHLQFLRF